MFVPTSKSPNKSLDSDRRFAGPFRLRHREELRGIVRTVVLERMGRRSAAAHVAKWARDDINATDQDRSREMAKDELLSLE